MKDRSWSIVIPLVAAAAAMVGVFVYYQFFSARDGEDAAVTAARSASVATLERAAGDGGFSFNAYESPRKLPEVPFVDGEGRDMTLSAFQGKLVLLNIWATWCVPCREEMPTLDRLEANLGGPDFQVVPLSIDQEGIPVVKEFYEELGLENLGIFVDDRMRAPPLLSVLGIPATLLIDREGREIGRKLGPAEWDSDEVVAEIRRYLE